jgi:IS5 family transposase
METPGFFRSLIDAMIILNNPLAMLAEAAVAAKFERQNHTSQSLDWADLFGPTAVVVGGSSTAAGRPKLPIRLMASLV